MENPAQFVEQRIEEIKMAVRVSVEVAILREVAKTALSRLATLDDQNAARYMAALKAIGEP